MSNLSMAVWKRLLGVIELHRLAVKSVPRHLDYKYV